MKKLFVLLSAVALFAASPVFADASGVQVTHVGGDVTITGSAGARVAEAGAACSTEDTIETKAGGTADIAVSGMAGCRLLPDTTCRIVAAGSETMKLAVDKGNVILNLQKLPAGSTFELETPVAIASVRGTQFWGRVLPAGAEGDPVTFAVREGVVEVLVKNVGQLVRLEAGQALDVSESDNVLPVVRPALEEELAAMAQAPEIATSM